MPDHPRYRSLFWPIILIAVGLVWFLVNINVIPNFNAAALLNLWPLLLIALGLDLIFGRRSPAIGLLIGLVTVGAAVAILVTVPNLGASSSLTTDRFTEPLGSATSASIAIDSASQHVDVHALSDSANLFEGVIQHTGVIDFGVTGGAEKHITLSQRSSVNVFVFGLTDFNAKWDIGLSNQVPLALTFNGGSGSSTLDLSALKVSSLNVDGGSGSYDITLPAQDQAYTVNYDGGSGSLSMSLAANSDVTVTLSGGSGSLSLNLPANSAARLDIRDNGSGSVSVPSRMARQSGSAGNDVGLWETSDYNSAAHKITIIVKNMGSGSLSID